MKHSGGSLLSKLTGLIPSGGGGSTLGVSIGTSAIKVVELKKSGKNYKLTQFGMIRLSDDAINNREIINNVAVTESLKKLIQTQKIKSKNACTGVSGNSVIIKRMSLEVPNLKELQEQVFWEAEQYLPFDVADVYMDFHMLSRGKDAKTDVLFVAAKKGVVDGYMTAIEGSGLKAQVIDTDFFALQNVVEANYPINPGEAICAADIGYSGIKIVILQEGVPVFQKDGSLGGGSLVADVQRHMNVSAADAENLIESASMGAVPQELSEILKVTGDNYAQEIRKAVDFYNASSSGAPVSSIILAGGGARVPELSRMVEERAGVPCQIINPFNSITYDSRRFTPEVLAAIGPVAAIPLGLAMRGLAEK